MTTEINWQVNGSTHTSHDGLVKVCQGENDTWLMTCIPTGRTESGLTKDQAFNRACKVYACLKVMG